MAATTANSTAETATDRDARMRRVAILLSSLPSPLAAKMLGTFDSESKQGLRRAMTTLSNVDSTERHRVIEAFRVSVGRQSNGQFAAVSEGGDTFESSVPSGSMNRYADMSTPPNSSGSSTPSAASPILKNAFPEQPSTEDHLDPSSPLAFLNDVDDKALSDLLKDEHPQAVALVLASVPAQQAGRVLPLLPEQLRSQAISRIGRLGEIPTQAAADLASHFRARLSQSASVKSTATGKRKLDAILATMPSAAPPSSNAPAEIAAVQSNSNSVNNAAANVSAIDQSHRLQVVGGNSDTDHRSQLAQQASPSQSTKRTQDAATPSAPSHLDASLGSTDAIHSRLVSLSPTQLCQSLARVETRDAMLCLCGLPNAVAEAALALLPKEQANTVRGQINGLSSLNLRDIDNAKESVAQASMIFAATSSENSTDSAAAA